MSTRPTILAVDRNRRNLELLSEVLDRHGYEAVTASGVEAMEAALDGGAAIDLVLLDLAGLDRRIWSCCERLREANVPFLVISPRQSAAIRQESLSRGAKSVLVKPVVAAELLALIHNLLEG